VIWPLNKGYIAHFSSRMRDTAIFLLLKSDVTIVFLDPGIL